MIISHKHKFIFFKTRKTAGTSIDIALSRHCGPEDTITYLNDVDEAHKVQVGSRTAQNYKVPLRNLTPKDYLKWLCRWKRVRYTEHMSIASLRPRIDQKILDSYFKFCVERNPFDKAVSLYYWRTRNWEVRPSILDFLKSVDDTDLSNFHIYSLEGRAAVDLIIRYEELGKGLAEVTDLLKIEPLVLPLAKGGIRKEGVHYREILTRDARAVIERVCGREIRLLGYKF